VWPEVRKGSQQSGHAGDVYEKASAETSPDKTECGAGGGNRLELNKIAKQAYPRNSTGLLLAEVTGRRNARAERAWSERSITSDPRMEPLQRSWWGARTCERPSQLQRSMIGSQWLRHDDFR
jgi:hypothetical protein